MKLLVQGLWSEQQVGELQASFPQVEFIRAATPEEVPQKIVDVDAMCGVITREAFLAARRLRWHHFPWAGVEWLPRIPELVESDVVVTNGRGAFSTTIAESTFSMLLYLTRSLGHNAMCQGQKAWKRERVPLFALAGLTMGVIGLGSIGTAIAQRAHGFDMKVIAVDAHPVARPDYVSSFWLLDGLPDLLRRSDVVAVATPITPVSRGMLGREQLALMKPTAYLMVMSRGKIVDEVALLEMLKEGRLAGAGLDVSATEPLPPESELWDAPNVVITPHSSGFSRQTDENVLSIFKSNLARFVAGEPLLTPVNKQLGY